jgi:hypothetical protein
MIATRTSLRLAIFFSALLGLVLNDHALKGAGGLPPWITGKLSDVCALIVAPSSLVWLFRARGRTGRFLCFVSVAAFFVGINLSASFAGSVRALLALMGVSWSLWVDPTDLAALPALLIGWWVSAGAGASDHRVARGLLAGMGALACVASGTPKHHSSAYVVNHTGAPLVVERTFLSWAHQGNHCNRAWNIEHQALLEVPDGWFRDQDFGQAITFELAPNGVLPLAHGCPVRLVIGRERRLVLVDPGLPSRPLPNIPESSEVRDPRGLLFVEGNLLAPLLRPGPGLSLRSVTPEWVPPLPSACAEAAVPRLDFGPLPQLKDAEIVSRRTLGGGCFATVVDLSAPASSLPTTDAAADGPAAADAEGGDGIRPDAARADGLEPESHGRDGSPDLFVRAPPRTGQQLLRFCMPEYLFPFEVGDRVHVSANYVAGVRAGSAQLLLNRSTRGIYDPNATLGPSVPCGFVRDACGAIWRPRQFSVNGVPLTAGRPVTAGGSTYYLARAADILTNGKCGTSDAQQIQWVEVKR